jgi:protein SCO1
MNRRSLCLALAAAALPLGAAHAHDNHGKPADTAKAEPSAPMAKPKRDPQAYFTDSELYTQDGKRVRFYSDVLKGRTVVINTIYADCADACPVILQQLLQVRAKLGDAFGRDIFFVTLTSDPERDSPQALKKYAQKQSADVPGWYYLTGRKADIDLILKRLGQWSANRESHQTHLIAWSFVTDRGRKMLPSMPPDLIAAQIALLTNSDSIVPLPVDGAAAR